MTPEEYGLWTYGRTVSNKSKVVYLSGRNISREFFETNKDAIYRIADGLESKGWAKQLRPKRRHPKTGQWISADYYFLSHEEWIAQYGDSFCKVSEFAHDPEAPVENSRQGDERACLDNPSSLSRILDGPVEIYRYPVENSRQQYKNNLDVQSKRERERAPEAKSKTPLAPSNSQINGQVSEVRSWMLGLDPPLKFIPASKDKEQEATKTIIARRLKEGIAVADIKSAIGRIPLDHDPNPSFAIRDSLDAAIDRVMKDREDARKTAETVARCMEEQQRIARREAEELAQAESAELALVEDTLPEG